MQWKQFNICNFLEKDLNFTIIIRKHHIHPYWWGFYKVNFQKHQGNCSRQTLRWIVIIPTLWCLYLFVILPLEFRQKQKDRAKVMGCPSHKSFTICLWFHLSLTVEEVSCHEWEVMLEKPTWPGTAGAEVLQQRGTEFCQQPGGAKKQIFARWSFWGHSSGWHGGGSLVRP